MASAMDLLGDLKRECHWGYVVARVLAEYYGERRQWQLVTGSDWERFVTEAAEDLDRFGRLMLLATGDTWDLPGWPAKCLTSIDKAESTQALLLKACAIRFMSPGTRWELVIRASGEARLIVTQLSPEDHAVWELVTVHKRDPIDARTMLADLGYRCVRDEFMAEQLLMFEREFKRLTLTWAIFERPQDYPNDCVLRRFWYRGQTAFCDRVPVCVGTLEECRASLPEGVSPVPRMDRDAPALLEAWW